MTQLNTPNGTLSFPTLFQPRPRSEGAEAVYSTIIIFSPEAQKSPQYKALQEACIDAARKKWGDKENLKAVKMPFRDASEKAGTAGFVDGDKFINPWSKSKPGVVDKNREEIFAPEDVWAGQLVRLNVTPFAWINSGKKGVSFALNHVQILDTDRPRIDGRVAAKDAFDDGEAGTGDVADIF